MNIEFEEYLKKLKTEAELRKEWGLDAEKEQNFS